MAIPTAEIRHRNKTLDSYTWADPPFNADHRAMCDEAPESWQRAKADMSAAFPVPFVLIVETSPGILNDCRHVRPWNPDVDLAVKSAFVYAAARSTHDGGIGARWHIRVRNASVELPGNIPGNMGAADRGLVLSCRLPACMLTVEETRAAAAVIDSVIASYLDAGPGYEPPAGVDLA